MDGFTILTIVVGFTAIAAWANERFVRLPSAIGVMLAGVAVSVGIIAASQVGWVDDEAAVELVQSLHFDTLLLAGHGSGTAGQGILLGILLFAAALQIEPASVSRRIGLIIWLATIGVVLTAIGTAFGYQWLLTLGGYDVQIEHLLLFGVILAPTDPVAALSLLRRTSAPVKVREVITGESLFNDGASIILFLFLVAFITGNSSTPLEGHWLLGFALESVGGIVVGIVLGLIGSAFIGSARGASVIVLVSLSLVLLVGVLAPQLYLSCPVTCAVAGLVLGRSKALSRPDGRLAIGFWGLVEQALTAMLFLMIGLELLAVHLSWSAVWWSLPVIPILLFVRFIALSIPWGVAKLMNRTAITLDELVLMTWCGLRGGVSIAMAIAVPVSITVADDSTLRSHALVTTILVVIASVLIQGLTVGRIAKLVQRRADRRAATA